MKIAVTADVNLEDSAYLNMQYANYAPKPLIDVITKYNHLPVIFPVVKKEMAKEYVSMVDAVIIPGGLDIAPFLYGKEPHPKLGSTYPARDFFEYEIVKEAVKANKPVLGICRGAQIINAYYGGTLYQDLTEQYPDKSLIQHSQSDKGSVPVHHVEIEKDSFLGKIFSKKAFVNSRHHQAIHTIGNGLKITAQAQDGVIEGIEHTTDPVLGVQWHPENLWETMPEEEMLFAKFFEYVATHQKETKQN